MELVGLMHRSQTQSKNLGAIIKKIEKLTDIEVEKP